MEPTNHPFRKENDLPNLHDYVPCYSSGVYNPNIPEIAGSAWSGCYAHVDAGFWRGSFLSWQGFGGWSVGPGDHRWSVLRVSGVSLWKVRSRQHDNMMGSFRMNTFNLYHLIIEYIIILWMCFCFTWTYSNNEHTKRDCYWFPLAFFLDLFLVLGRFPEETYKL